VVNTNFFTIFNILLNFPSFFSFYFVTNCALRRLKRMKQLALLFVLVFLASCSGEPEKIHLRTEKGPRQEATPVNANTLMTMEVEGMTCEMGCGGTIRKGLKGTGAVARVRYNWVEGEDVQKAFVSYDSNKVSEKELIDIVSKLNDRQFSVSAHSTMPLEEETGATPEKSVSEDTESTLDMSEDGFEFPNLVNILRDLIVG
jgi:copper chaperone CopZ